MGDASDVGEQVVFRHEHVVDEVMGLQPGQGQGPPPGPATPAAVMQGRTGGFELAPDLGRRTVNVRVGVVQAFVVGGQDVAPFVFGQISREPAPGFGVHPFHVVEEPVDLRLTAEKDAAQREAPAAVRMGDAVGQRQGRPPGAAEHEPFVDVELAAQGLHVVDQVLGRVVAGLAEGGGAPGAALVEHDDAVMIGVEEPAVRRVGAGPRPAVQKDHRHAGRIA